MNFDQFYLSLTSVVDKRLFSQKTFLCQHGYFKTSCRYVVSICYRNTINHSTLTRWYKFQLKEPSFMLKSKAIIARCGGMSLPQQNCQQCSAATALQPPSCTGLSIDSTHWAELPAQPTYGLTQPPGTSYCSLAKLNHKVSIVSPLQLNLSKILQNLHRLSLLNSRVTEFS